MLRILNNLIAYLRPIREVHIRDHTHEYQNNFAAVLYKNGKHLHTIGMDKYDQEYINKITEAWVQDGKLYYR
tara:strand:+ start:13 stop:228 length:216 start_codon:yes stop_codon:yes gene_type:complete